MRWRAVAVAAFVALLAAPACGRSGDDDDGFRLEVDGRARIGDRVVADGGHRVSGGETVTMLAGEAVLELPGDRSVLLRAGEGDRDATMVEVSTAPDVVAGDAVVMADDDVRFRVGDVDVRLTDGAARVQRGLSVTVAIYRGRAEVRSAGRAFDGGLPALRQLSIAATGLLPREAVPLVYDEQEPDPWDQRFIGGAIDLGSELDIRARGFTGQLGPSARADADLLRRVLPPLVGEVGLDELVNDDRSPGEALVGASIVVESDRGSFGERWDDVFSFREDGARWGLVAFDQKVKRDALLERINDAFGRSPLLFAVVPDDGGSGGTALGPTGGGDGTTSTTGPDGGSGGGGDDGGDDGGDGGDGGNGGGGDEAPLPTIPPITVPPTTVPGPNEDSPPDGEDSPNTVTELLDALLDTVGDGMGEGVAEGATTILGGSGPGGSAVPAEPAAPGEPVTPAELVTPPVSPLPDAPLGLP